MVLASFLLAPKAAERPAFTITVMLALTVAESDVVNQLPKTSQPVFLQQFLQTLTFFAAGITAYHLLMCFIGSTFCDARKGQSKAKVDRKEKLLRLIDLICFAAATAAFILSIVVNIQNVNFKF